MSEVSTETTQVRPGRPRGLPKTGGRIKGISKNKPKVPTLVPTAVAAGVATAAGAAPPPGAPAIPMRAGAREATAPSGLKIRYESLDNLREYERNANEHPPAQIALIERLLTKFGWTTSMGKAGGVLIYGHARRQAALNLRDKGVMIPGNPDPDKGPVVDLSHLSKIDRRLYVIADNESARKSVTNADLLALEVQELGELGADLALTGLDDGQLSALRDDGGGGGLTDPDEVPPTPAAPVTVLGDVWLLGKHRILCGDCTLAEDVARVMDGVQAVLMNTDPPYGVDYAAVKNGIPRSGFKNIQAEGGDIANDDLTDGVALQAFLESAIRAAVPHLIDRAAFYFWHPMLTQGKFFAAAAAAAADILIHRQIIWVKPGFVLTRSGMYHWRHELCFYGWRRGNVPAWFGNKSQSSVWDDLRQDVRGDHPTQKPVELFERPILNHSKADEVVYEPFSGSGSQMIAAEMHGRRCFGIEIEPRYVDVAIRRWQAFVGQEATLEGNGRTFAAIEANRAAKPARVKARVKVAA